MAVKEKKEINIKVVCFQRIGAINFELARLVNEKDYPQ